MSSDALLRKKLQNNYKKNYRLFDNVLFNDSLRLFMSHGRNKPAKHILLHFTRKLVLGKQYLSILPKLEDTRYFFNVDIFL